VADPIGPRDTVLILLAAGRSTRFADHGSKLTEELLGRPLGLHAAATLAALPFRDRLAIVDGLRLDYTSYGFTHVHNDAPAEGMSHSIRLGVERAGDARAALVVLADMPRLTATHVGRLFDAATGTDSVVASSDGVAPMPPVLFGADHFGQLRQLSGDNGARSLVAGGRHVVASPAELIDVDTRAQLDGLRATLTRGAARRSD
jgi:molybdenum cofactor cytidylyltransferase